MRWALSAPKSQRFLRFAIAMPIADPRNRSDDFCDLRLRCPSRTLEIAAISETRERGEFGPGRLHAAPPGQRSSSCDDVCLILASMSCSCRVVVSYVVIPIIMLRDWNGVRAMRTG